MQYQQLKVEGYLRAPANGALCSKWVYKIQIRGSSKNSKQDWINFNEYARKVHQKPSIVKQLFIACITFKTDVANFQSN